MLACFDTKAPEDSLIFTHKFLRWASRDFLKT